MLNSFLATSIKVCEHFSDIEVEIPFSHLGIVLTMMQTKTCIKEGTGL